MAGVYANVMSSKRELFKSAGFYDDDPIKVPHIIKWSNTLLELSAHGESGMPANAFERRLGSVKVAAGLSDNNIISFVEVRVKFESRGVERFVSELLEQELLTWGISLSARR